MANDPAITARPCRRQRIRTSTLSHLAPFGAGTRGLGSGSAGPVAGPRSERAPAGLDDLSDRSLEDQLAVLKAVAQCPVTFAAVLARFGRWADERVPVWETRRVSQMSGVLGGGRRAEPVPDAPGMM